MPIFSAIGDVGRRALAPALGQDCVLCGGGAGRLVCESCEAGIDLPMSRCTRCAIALPASGLCGDCLQDPPVFDAAIAAFEYRFPLDCLVRRFKFQGDLAIGRWLAEALAARVRAEAPPALVLAPPSTAPRLRERGFNPALEIAKVVGRRIGCPCALDALRRTRETFPQPGLARRERRSNLEGAFDCTLDLRGLHVAFVDDVLTTGATADVAAAALKEAGAVRVSVWIVARTPQRDV